ncbi:MAG: TlpA disulfide reductase family protein [Candidatus Margulisiibacteriota bacterium]|nr:TlpA disulfide reductase family protein [Candidatus Margulisiibacteriota bacterium]
MVRKIIVVAAIVLALISPTVAKSALEIGSPPPELKLIEPYLGNRVIILNFFASFSKSCKGEAIFLQELSKKYGKKGLKVIGVSFDRKSKKLKQFIDENNLSYKIFHDKKLKTLKDYRILILPTLFVIDKPGNIKNIYVDFDKNVSEALSKEIKDLLAPSKKI